MPFKKLLGETSLVVQWLKFWVFTGESIASIPGQELRSCKPHMVCQKKKKKENIIKTTQGLLPTAIGEEDRSLD